MKNPMKLKTFPKEIKKILEKPLKSSIQQSNQSLLLEEE
jgi:hypothetical protein